MILLDTNILLWLFMGDKRLLLDIQRKIEENPANYYVSVVTLWEIATKRTNGKLELTMDMPKAVQDAGFTSLPLKNEHIHQYEALPLIHRDPFDRMLVAQALSENISMISGDKFLADYGVRITVR